jgi:group I intron endonuclease
MGSDSVEESRGVYLITVPSGKVYVGMTTKSFSGRWTKHLQLMKRGQHHCIPLQRAYQKYGAANFEFSVLEVMDNASKVEIENREQYWWDYLRKTGVKIYNGRPSGTGSVSHTLATRKMIGVTLTERSKVSGVLLKKEKISATCSYCRKLFMRSRGKLLLREKAFCSRKCSALGRSIQISKEELVDLYVEKKLSQSSIAKMHGTSQQAISRLMERYEITVR